MGTSVRILVVLSAITAASGVCLGGLYQATHERAENNILKFKKIPAVLDIYETIGGELEPARREALEKELLDEKKLVDIGGKEPLLVFLVKKEERPYAVALESFGQGFGGEIGVMVGFDLDAGGIVAIGITTMSETPGIGTRVREKVFTDQFADLADDAVISVKKEGGVIDAVSGATISSRAVTGAVRGAKAAFAEHRAAIEQAIAPGAAAGEGDR